MTQQRYWRISAAAGADGTQHATLYFYGLLADDPGDNPDDQSPGAIARALEALGPIASITARINSPGGSALAGLALHNLLKDWPAPVTTQVDGLAGSAASILFMAGATRLMPGNTLLYLHRPTTAADGTAEELRQAAAELDTIAGAIVQTYQAGTGLTAAAVQALLDPGTLLTAEEAYLQGFATAIPAAPVTATLQGETLTAGGQTFDLAAARIRLTPAARAAVLHPPTAAEIDARQAAAQAASFRHRLAVMTDSAGRR